MYICASGSFSSSRGFRARFPFVSTLLGGVIAACIYCRSVSLCCPALAGALRRSFDRIVHTVPPLWGSAEEAEWRRLLASCYASAFALAWRDCPVGADMRTLRLAVPLLGAGAAGAPLQKAAAVAASAAMAFDAPRPALRGGALPPASLDVCFAVIDDEQAGVLEEAIEAACEALPWEASPADGPSLP